MHYYIAKDIVSPIETLHQPTFTFFLVYQDQHAAYLPKESVDV